MIGAKSKLFSAEPKASKVPGTRTEDVAKLVFRSWPPSDKSRMVIRKLRPLQSSSSSVQIKPCSPFIFQSHSAELSLGLNGTRQKIQEKSVHIVFSFRFRRHAFAGTLCSMLAARCCPRGVAQA